MIRVLEMRESVKILEQAFRDLPEGDVIHPKARLRGFKPPVGEAYGRIEAPKGELGFYLISDGSPNPYRYRVRPPSFINLTVLEDMCLGQDVADVIVILGLMFAGFVTVYATILHQSSEPQLGVQAVYANHDDDPYAIGRDTRIRGRLAEQGIALHTSKDHVVFERSELMTRGGGPYSVFTPYKNAWLKALTPYQLKAYPTTHHAGALAPRPDGEAGVPTLVQIGFEASNLHQLRLPSGSAGAKELLDDFLQRIDQYHESRDFPAVKGPSYLSTHLRFGTVSIRRLAREAHARMVGGQRGAEVWLSELIWRDFYHQVLHHHPHVVGKAFKPEYDRIRWAHGKQADAHFAAWCEGRTGYPLVDAAMHQINQTGYMHNRLRMVVASFLVKDLGLDWRRGETYFAEKLNDFDLAANNGGWQWAASSGCDAQPYFRIFNPVTQSRRFDADGRFIRRYLPMLAKLPDKLIHSPWTARPIDLAAAGITLGRDYPQPLVAHDEARARTLERYAVVKGG
jgi:deoxyribodipyrimidine photo-lyase